MPTASATSAAWTSAQVVLPGDAGGNLLSGGARDDRVGGRAGNDVVGGNAGDDVLDGGAGVDARPFSDSAGLDVVVDMAAGSISGGGCDGSSVVALENVQNWSDAQVKLLGDGGDNLLLGWTRDDRLEGRTGNDTLTGYGGNVTFAYGADLGADAITASAWWRGISLISPAPGSRRMGSCSP